MLSRVSFTNFVKKFCSCLRHHLSHEWIKFPTSTAELSSISAEYAKKGFPRCCGSTDGVQIPWEGCSYAYRTSFSGKEGYPTLGFNVTVAHDLRILHVCSMFADRFNDKTKQRCSTTITSRICDLALTIVSSTTPSTWTATNYSVPDM